jgi:hypothetical protein
MKNDFKLKIDFNFLKVCTGCSALNFKTTTLIF